MLCHKSSLYTHESMSSSSSRSSSKSAISTHRAHSSVWNLLVSYQYGPLFLIRIQWYWYVVWKSGICKFWLGFIVYLPFRPTFTSNLTQMHHFDPQLTFFTTGSSTKMPKFHHSLLYLLKTTHATSTIAFSMLIPPTEHHIDSPSAHVSPTHPKVVYTRKVVCIPLLITAGLSFWLRSGRHTGKSQTLPTARIN